MFDDPLHVEATVSTTVLLHSATAARPTNSEHRGRGRGRRCELGLLSVTLKVPLIAHADEVSCPGSYVCHHQTLVDPRMSFEIGRRPTATIGR